MKDTELSSIDEMRDPDFTSIDNNSVGLNTVVKDNCDKKQAAHVEFKKFDGNPINYEHIQRSS